MAGAVELDTRDLQRGLRTLAADLPRAAHDAARLEAERTARELAPRVPVRTGALRATVGVVSVHDGYGVTYGDGLRYASLVEGRTHAIRDTTDTAGEQFRRTAETAAGKVVDGL